MQITQPYKQRRAALFAQWARQGFVRAGDALIAISPEPSFKVSSSRQIAHRLLTNVYADPDMAEEIAKIMSADEVKELFTEFARDKAKPDQTRLQANIAMGKVHALFIERNINENLNKNVSDESLDPSVVAIEALRMLRESEQSGAKLAQAVDVAQSPQAIDTKADAPISSD